MMMIYIYHHSSIYLPSWLPIQRKLENSEGSDANFAKNFFCGVGGGGGSVGASKDGVIAQFRIVHKVAGTYPLTCVLT
jgi:hypothetical protein